VVHYDPSVFKAFSPYFAGAFLVRNGYNGWMQLGGILLAFTGVETLFADLGAFNRQSVLPHILLTGDVSLS
jgi:KUP system potassium uptake protein